MLGVTSLDREIEDRVGKIDAVFLPNIGFTGRITMRPYVLLIHDLSFLIEPKWFSMKQRLWHRAVDAISMIKNAAHLLAVSETTKRDAMRLLNIPEERITVIPLGPTMVGAGFPRPDPSVGFGGRGNRAPTTKYILALGGNDPRKNTTTGIEAVRVIRQEKEFENLELILVGAGFPRPDPSDPVGFGGRGNRAPTWIRFVARPSDPQLATLYSGAAAFLYPSWYEGYGLPLHEAASFGTPCIASTAGALPETAPPGTIFADPAKPHHWVEALRTVLSIPLLTKEGLGEVSEGSGWADAAKRLNQAITSVIR